MSVLDRWVTEVMRPVLGLISRVMLGSKDLVLELKRRDVWTMILDLAMMGGVVGVVR